MDYRRTKAFALLLNARLPPGLDMAKELDPTKVSEFTRLTFCVRTNSS